MKTRRYLVEVSEYPLQLYGAENNHDLTGYLDHCETVPNLMYLNPEVFIKDYGKTFKIHSSGLASTTQAIYREFRESISNPNLEKVFFYTGDSTWRRPGLYRRQPDVSKQTLLSLKAHISGKPMYLEKKLKRGLSNPFGILWK
ncbi:hypothetical protein ACSAZL_10465 [Methanosarcina sp. T3]|uniref:hypothetical protein n=1 Tax=Methanosarcina sp. T3 TaxID=3439062 RepID=UPI003F84872E